MMTFYDPIAELSDRELDVLIARHYLGVDVIEGWPCGTNFDSGEPWASESNPTDFPSLYPNLDYVYREGNYSQDSPSVVPAYSTDLNTAMEIVERIRTDG